MSMDAVSVLEVKNITKEFPGVRALNNVSFNLKKGEIHALVGENGAGKSTLISVIMGLHKPDDGYILMDNNKVVIDSPITALSHGLAMVPQELNLIPELTVAENIFLGIRKVKRGLPRVDWKSVFFDAEELLKKVGADIDVRTKAGILSVANQQLIQVARALAYNAKILIFDEPTSCLTVQESEKILSLMDQFKQEGKSIVFITHHLDEVIKASDTISVMRDGNMVGTIINEGISKQEIIKMMVGREIVSKKMQRNAYKNESILRVEGATRKKEFNNISFDVNRGEIFGIAGLIGAGRTELVQAIFGETKLEEGKIYFDGKPVNIKSPGHAIKLGIGYVPEERKKYGIFPVLSVRENITMPFIDNLSKFFRINKNKENEVANEYVKKTNIKTPTIKTQIVSLSGGNQQKTILSRWLAKGVNLLILDEPTRGIDVASKEEIYNLIRDFANAGLTILLISSELEEVLLLSDRVMIMHEGQFKGLTDSHLISTEGILQLALS